MQVKRVISKLTLINTGPISIRNIKGITSLHGTQNVKDVEIWYARSHMDTSYKILPKKEEYLSVVEFTTSAFDPSEKSGSRYIKSGSRYTDTLKIFIYCDHANIIILNLYADGLRYRHTWRPRSPIGDDSELIMNKLGTVTY